MDADIYAAQHGLVSRKDLRENVQSLFDELPDDEFHQFYSLLWKMTAKNQIIRGQTLIEEIEKKSSVKKEA